MDNFTEKAQEIVDKAHMSLQDAVSSNHAITDGMMAKRHELLKLIAQALREARKEAFEVAAKIAEDGYLMPLEDWQQDKKEFSARFARKIAAAIRKAGGGKG